MTAVTTTTDELIFECKGTCGRMTRPGRMPESKAPGTVPRAAQGMCRKEYYATRTAPPTDVRITGEDRVARAAHAAAGLESFMAQRKARLAARGR